MATKKTTSRSKKKEADVISERRSSSSKKTPKQESVQKQTISKKQADMVRHMHSGAFLATLVPWLLGILAVFFGGMLLFPKHTGAVGPAVSGFLRGLFSVGAYLLPPLLLNIAVFWSRDRKNGVRAYKAIFSVFFLLFFSAFLGLFAPKDVLSSFDSAVLYEAGTRLSGGGLFGSLVANALSGSISGWLSGILFLFLLLVSGAFLLGKTPLEILRLIGAKIREKREAARAWQEAGEGEEGEVFEKEAQKEQTSAEPEIPAPTDDVPPFLPEDEIFDGKTVDHTPDEDEMDIRLNPAESDVNGEDIKKLNPRRAGTLTEAVADVFDQSEDPDVARRFSDEPVEDSIEDELNAAIDLEGEKEEKPVKRPAVYRFPPLSLLSDEKVRKTGAAKEARETADKLIRTLETFHVNTTLLGISQGPTVTRYELQPEVGVRVKTIAGLADDIALRLAAKDVRIEAPIPGREAVGFEVPNKTVSKVRIRELLEDSSFKRAENPLVACLGMDVAGEHVFCELNKMPHLLIAGATGSGKSVCINSFLCSILYKATPEEVKLILIDPKSVELTGYNGIGHLLVPVVCDPKKAAGALNWAVNEMERRYALIGEKCVRNIQAYNKIAREQEEEPMSHIVIIIDELADLMMTARDSVENAICRLAQKARAAGIHLILGTQRPSVDVITGLIKSNIPSRIAFTVASQIDSRTILDSAGAERLLGYGDMLYAPVGSTKPIRVQGAFVSDEEIASVVEFLKREKPAAYSEETMADIEKEAAMCDKKKGSSSSSASADSPALGDQDMDELFFAAAQLALDNGGIATSLLQRRLSVGYARAARLIDAMEERGIVGPHNGSKPREILITREEFLEMKQNHGEIG